MKWNKLVINPMNSFEFVLIPKLSFVTSVMSLILIPIVIGLITLYIPLKKIILVSQKRVWVSLGIFHSYSTQPLISLLYIMHFLLKLNTNILLLLELQKNVSFYRRHRCNPSAVNQPRYTPPSVQQNHHEVVN